MSVEEYIRELEQFLMRCDIPELLKHIIDRFLGGLNIEIADLVEHQSYWSFEDVCKLTIKVKKQLKRGKGLSTKSSTRKHLSLWMLLLVRSRTCQPMRKAKRKPQSLASQKGL